MKQVLVFGAGKSATVLIEYLLDEAEQQNWFVTVVDADLSMARSKTGNHKRGNAISFDINNEADRRKELENADIVISMLPPHLHILVRRLSNFKRGHFARRQIARGLAQDLPHALRLDLALRWYPRCLRCTTRVC